MPLIRSAILILGLAVSAAAQPSLPRFEDFPVTSIYRGRTAPVVITRDNRMFRTRLRWAARNLPPTFAGRYILTTWGCGTNCLMGALIDARTGQTHFLPFTLCCWSPMFGWDEEIEPIEFDLRSRLIIFRGARDEEGMGTYYYKWENNRFVLLRAIERPQP